MTADDEQRLSVSLARLGREQDFRARLVALCREAEPRLAERDVDVRETVTGPIVDALHRDLGLLEKRLRSGITFHFHYRGKIARDFVMSEDAEPDHVWEPQTTRLLLHLSHSAKTVVVGGAYAGDQAILIAQRIAGHGGVCHCFEPNTDQLAVLRHNAAANGLGNLVANRMALSDTAADDFALVGEDAYARAEASGTGTAADPFAATTLDAYAERLGLGEIDLIMLDIEGGELSALKGTRRFLARPAAQAPAIVFEVHRSYVDWSEGLHNTEVVRYLRGLGYDLFAVRDYQSNVPMAGLPIELIRPEETYLEGPPHGFNMLAVKDASVIDDPNFRLCAWVSPKLLRHRDPSLHQPLHAGS